MNLEEYEKPKNKVYQNIPMVNGLFSKMNYTFWDFNNADLDTMLISHCGFKRISPIVKIAYEINPTDPIQYLADIILNTYKRRWDRLQEVSNIEYDPIRNFSDNLIKEVFEDDIGENKLDNTNQHTSKQNQNTEKSNDENSTKLTSQSGKDKQTRTDNLTSKDTKDLTDDLPSKKEDDLYGFNSSSPVGSDVSTLTSTQKHTGTETINSTGTQTNETEYGKTDTETDVIKSTGTIKLTTDDIANDVGNSYGSYNKNLHRTETYTRLGNIGNISSQKLIKEEIEIWRWNFINEVINDVKLFISLPIYG